MGLLANIFGNGNNINIKKDRQKNRNFRVCRIEEMESRDLLSASPFVAADPIDSPIDPMINFGVYFHDGACEKNHGESSVDTFIISWNGAANGTMLSRLEIDLSTSHFNSDTGERYLFFDLETFSKGLHEGVAICWEESTNHKLVLTFDEQFTLIDGKFKFTISIESRDGTVNQVVNGRDMGGVSIEATFVKENYYEQTDIKGNLVSWYIDPNHPVDYVPDPENYGMPHYFPKMDNCCWGQDANGEYGWQGTGHLSAGFLVGNVQQVSVMGSLSGTVYHDKNGDGTMDPNEKGIDGVKLSLWRLEGDTYVKIAETTTSNGGHYEFTGLRANETYKIVQKHPNGWQDWHNNPGNMNGSPDADAWVVERHEGNNFDAIKNIWVPENGLGTEYNFGHYKNGSISGNVFYIKVDGNGDPIYEDGVPVREKGIGEVTVTLLDKDGNVVATEQTNSEGFYKFTDLDPFATYDVWISDGDWRVYVGTIKGRGEDGDHGTPGDNIITDVELDRSGQRGKEYNFGKIPEPPPPPPPPDDCKCPTCDCTGCDCTGGSDGNDGNDGKDGTPGPQGPPGPPGGGYSGSPSSFHYPSPAAGIGGPFVAPGAPAWQSANFTEPLRGGFGSGGVVAGTGGIASFSWQLSVINAGYPRANGATDGIAVGEHASKTTVLLSDSEGNDIATGARYVSVAWTPLPMAQSSWLIRGKDGIARKRFTFGPDGGIPVVGDFSGDGIANIAVYHNGNWYIDLNGNGVWDEEDLWAQMGGPADQPVVGDWDGDGKTDIGIFGPMGSGDHHFIASKPGLPTDLNTTISTVPKNVPPDIAIHASMNNVRAMKHSMSGGVRLDVVDHVFQYGNAGDKAFTGDFTGDGISTIGVYRDGKWYIDKAGTGKWDENAVFVNNADFGLGPEGIPVIGDWNGDGVDKIGLYVNGVWYLDTTGDFTFNERIEFGQVGDYPVVGDFDGSGIAQLAVYRASSAEPLYASAPEPMMAVGEGMIARQFTGEVAEEDQGLLKNHSRSETTPHTNAPLLRGR